MRVGSRKGVVNVLLGTMTTGGTEGESQHQFDRWMEAGRPEKTLSDGGGELREGRFDWDDGDLFASVARRWRGLAWEGAVQLVSPPPLLDYHEEHETQKKDAYEKPTIRWL